MSTNDITGDSITTATKHNSKAFRDNYDAIFNKEKKMETEQSHATPHLLVDKGVIDVKALSNRHLEEQNSGKDVLMEHLDRMEHLHNLGYEELVKNIKIDYKAMQEVGDIISGAEVKEEESFVKNFSTPKEGMSPETQSRAAARTEQMSLEMDKLNEDIKKAGEALGVASMTTEQVLDTLIEHVGKVRNALVDVGLIVEEEQAPFDTTFVPEELPKGLVEDEL